MKNKVIFITTMCFVILCGLAMIGFGVKLEIDKNNKTKNYVSIKAEYIGSDRYDEEGDTHSLEYKYIVNGETYYISTDYGTSVEPKDGTTKTIRYNPDNPSEAVISGAGGNFLLFLIGGMFTLIPIIFIMTSDNEKKNTNQRLKKIKSNIISLLVGLIFTGMGAGVYYALCDASDGLSPINLFKNAGVVGIFPIIFLALGIYMILITLFAKRNKELVLTVESIEEYDGTYNVVLFDDNIQGGSWKTLTNKYFIYSTENKEKFTEGKKYNVNIYKYGMLLELVPIGETVQARSLNNFCDEDFEEFIV